MNDSVKKIILFGSLIVFVIGFYFIKNLNQEPDYRSKYEGYDLVADIEGIDREGTYSKYLSGVASANYPQKDVIVPIYDYIEGENVEEYRDYGEEAKALFTDDDSSITWDVEVPEAGLYNIYLEYMTVESRGVAVERAIYINEELPFIDAGTLAFSRLWTDGNEVKTDNQGNQIRPSQVEKFDWQSTYFKDDKGYITKPYEFYFEKGKNTITLEAVNEPMVIRNLELKAVSDLQSYLDYFELNKTQKASSNLEDYIQMVQGEDAVLRSEPSLYAKYDRSSPTTEPNSVTTTLLNYTGGETWNSAGQWIEWNIEVPEDGYYNISIKGRQNYARGSISSRSLYIDGEVPFKEVKSISFEYDNDWKVKTLSDEEGNPYQFYLSKGTHTIRLEASLEQLGAILEELEDSSYRLNQIYRTLLIYIGATPDKYRDYNLNLVYPDVIEAMSLESKRLYKIVDDVVAYTGQKAEKIATAQTLAQQLERFVKRPEKISVDFKTFKDNITALGTAMLTMSESKLDVDYIVVSAVGVDVPKDKSSGLAKAWHEIKSFFASFVVNYNSVGDVYAEDEEGIVTIWVVTGRDQGTILKSMVDDTFTPNNGIKVNVEIVAPDALLSAVVAGRGPNIVLSVGADQPVNYALRNAVEDLTQFDGWEEVFEPYYESAYRPYQLNDGIYAVPETQTYNVLFYRKDIMEELDLSIPQTWSELIAMFPTIQGNNMNIGIPLATTAVAGVAAQPDLSLYYTLVYQNGSDIYDEAGMNTTIDNEAGVDAFDTYIKFFNDYGVPVEFDFVNRFRSGEMPLGISNFSIYNILMVSAPEIRGLWGFTLIPGITRTDEAGNTYIDRSVFSTGNCSMMIKTEDDKTRNNAWEFLKWWADSETQVRFGRELEALLGSSARYATANTEAFEQLAWSAKDISVLEEQWKWTVGFREVPGGYYTTRHINNAVRKVINDKDDPRETVLDYAITIDEELTKKRNEFGLPIK